MSCSKSTVTRLPAPARPPAYLRHACGFALADQILSSFEATAAVEIDPDAAPSMGGFNLPVASSCPLVARLPEARFTTSASEAPAG